MLLSNKYHRLGAISLHIALLDSSKPLQYFFIEVFSNRQQKVFVAVVASIWWSPTKIFFLTVGAASTPPEFWDWNIWVNNWIIWQNDWNIWQNNRNIWKNNWNIWQNISSSATNGTCQGRTRSTSMSRRIDHSTDASRFSWRFEVMAMFLPKLTDTVR